MDADGQPVKAVRDVAVSLNPIQVSHPGEDLVSLVEPGTCCGVRVRHARGKKVVMFGGEARFSSGIHIYKEYRNFTYFRSAPFSHEAKVRENRLPEARARWVDSAASTTDDLSRPRDKRQTRYTESIKQGLSACLGMFIQNKARRSSTPELRIYRLQSEKCS